MVIKFKALNGDIFNYHSNEKLLIKSIDGLEKYDANEITKMDLLYELNDFILYNENKIIGEWSFDKSFKKDLLNLYKEINNEPYPLSESKLLNTVLKLSRIFFIGGIVGSLIMQNWIRFGVALIAITGITIFFKTRKSDETISDSILDELAVTFNMGIVYVIMFFIFLIGLLLFIAKL